MTTCDGKGRCGNMLHSADLYSTWMPAWGGWSLITAYKSGATRVVRYLPLHLCTLAALAFYPFS